MHAILSLLFVLFIVSACAIEEKPQYYINGASLRNYQGGDLLTYTVFDTGQEDGQGKYNITLLSRDKSPPINNETLNLLFESVQKTGNFTEPFLPQYFSQGDDGALRLEAIANGEDVLWLLDSEETKTGDILYPADLST
ncbi:MAG TPA: hypothetical protein ENK06_13775, partial [Gammaproteobacteria bacterium]|nr:hypothetical protein [Gammaproteobacteria bacterium]